MQIWQNLDNFSLGDGYMKVYCVILSTFKYVWKFHTKKSVKSVKTNRVKKSRTVKKMDPGLKLVHK